jgi:hypothetical protein
VTEVVRLAAVPPRTAYLSAADRQTEAFVDLGQLQASFEASLLQNVLFESAVVIPDVFFFISSGLSGHIINRSHGNVSSLLEAAVASGAAIPAFRDHGIGSFRDAYDVIRGQGIRGLLGNDECRRIYRHLDLAMLDGSNEGKFRSVNWPTMSIGTRFEQRLVNFFQPKGADIPPVDNSTMRSIWQRTERWRRDCLDEARAAGSAGGGFKRGDYMAAIGRSLGIEEVVDDVTQLFRYPGLSEDDASALRALCLWMNECYQYNQARAFGADPSWARFRPDLSIATISAMEESDPNGSPAPQLVETTVTALVPPPQVLLRMNAKQLLDIRTERAGGLYFAALDDWRKNPFDDGATNAVNEEFQNYARVLREKASKQSQYSETPLRQKLVRWDGPSRSLALTAAAALGSGMSAETRFFTPFIALSGLGYATYIWGKERSRKTSYNLKAAVEVNISA